MTEIITTAGRLSPLEGTDTPLISPEEARSRLESFGYTDEDFGRLSAGQENSNHFVHALAVISSGSEARDINSVYHDLYSADEKTHMTQGDIEADAASERAWEKLAHLPK